jgi:hypothetical protein
VHSGNEIESPLELFDCVTEATKVMSLPNKYNKGVGNVLTKDPNLWGYTPTGDKKKQFFHLLQTRKENKEFMVIL